MDPRDKEMVARKIRREAQNQQHLAMTAEDDNAAMVHRIVGKAFFDLADDFEENRRG